MWYVCDVLYTVLYVCVCCFVVRGCAVSRRYIDVCYCDMFSVVNINMYLNHLKLLLFATTRSVFKSVKVSVVEIAIRTN